MLDIISFIEEKGGGMVLSLHLAIDTNEAEPELIRESQRRRGAPVETVDEVIEMYKDWVATRFKLDSTNREINAIQKDIGKKMKAKEDASEFLAKKAALEKTKAELITEETTKESAMKKRALTIGNIVHKSVPVSMDEDNNELIKTWAPEGSVTGSHTVEEEALEKKVDITVEKKDCLSHHEVLTRIDGYDPERGVKVVGHRGYFLRQYGVFFNQALINYGLNFLSERGYIPLQTPQLMNKDVMAKTAQLEQFDEELYKVIDGQDEKYLIATSEQPISAYHSDEWFDNPADLPIKYAGFSSCYRREAGSHGKDAWGIFRVHTFEKIEQFVLTAPEDSWDMFDKMIGASEEFYQSLKLPYRIVAIVSGALNNAAAKKYDLEAWFPFQGEYKELVSCSNCTDYQSRRLEIRYGIKKMGEREKKYVHCLNSTLCATERALCCILENYQTPDGVIVPEVLRPYMGGKTFLPFTKALPKNSTSTKRK
ncbi:Seryl-tRNA synthetase,cytoplasmic [Taphrina deformans PYCC 5710]|uniref:serine--tRNA ligase n=1 Tax=Taphrina deformans (strain PYCC 5710 / ATCC 11124 / CBS 356.35 / IMI 108563 / JCM 9778 / NBRC 8474) TaxID=1097556 RepID=R4X8M0_TAPDE|nr:Seryl-tRNA synthetase,cytoplasmic [Taphrina deformans PYCC 5710]|eukprot:CCG81968.1 Seryl-tRNA synthetase,cytoplasmic [Taphrina deformans PYCC 5710]